MKVLFKVFQILSLLVEQSLSNEAADADDVDEKSDSDLLFNREFDHSPNVRLLLILCIFFHSFLLLLMRP